MKNYYRVIQGKGSKFADEAFKGNFIGTSFMDKHDLSRDLPENWRDFNKKFIPVFLEENPEKTKVAAGLACGMLWTIVKGIGIGDVVLCPDGRGSYRVGEITGVYSYCEGIVLPHRRPVRWFSNTVSREDMSEALRNSSGSIGTVSNLSKYAIELEKLISGTVTQSITSNDETIEDVTIFALEKHLEDFLVHNWSSTDLGKRYDVYTEDGEVVGQQYPTDTGPIDILAISKDKSELLVVELKKGRISDVVVGQIQRYMGYTKDELAEAGQKVRGAIIAFEDDIRLRRSLSVTQNIEFFTYRISFKLEKKV